MPPIGTLWGGGYQRQTTIIESVAAISGLELTEPEIKFGVTNKTPEYLAKFPLGKVPAFESADGSCKLTEGLAIASYVASLAPETGLQGKNKVETAQIDQWMHFAESELQTFSDFSLYLTWGYMPGYTKEHRALDYLEKYLADGRVYLVGERLTIADITLAASLKSAVKVTLGAAERAKYPDTMAYFDRIRSIETIKEKFGPVEFAEVPAQFKDAAK
ncbi:glutathione S-transferase C-terminal-like protein [Coniophora puteana RWD-64-598 SS2]|uniref:Glutathione S-transferase C-terminal-like protein n=1 Tax=Coniophora puteana (strain RWD-64-598) TaxID=741705 RepID=A0A5M3MC58_CONPW|nr:glutathione S-transferase C-terminal-like protein [Coniophora puteana RWD-64-598 SS2]EIW76637.1 glutathione S-transferase C-terminal-like protein [Coniophora puteana RWD-64-598 SS2]